MPALVKTEVECQADRPAAGSSRCVHSALAAFPLLDLIAGIFGMNFEFTPLAHEVDGFRIAMPSVLVIGELLVLIFWLKRYLACTRCVRAKKKRPRFRSASFLISATPKGRLNYLATAPELFWA
ncbi:hypothetical protein [Variovorax sp. 54]|uniref:hypothetical protein n=1 Tax=Variovorax sp. 54 TaxID=2035212 RepID=UPI00359F4CBC